MKSSPPSQHGFALPAGMLEATFPFYLHWDADLRIVGVGSSLAKAVPQAVAGMLMTGLFRLRRPVGEMGGEIFRQDGSVLFLFESIHNGMLLRGQVLELGEEAGFLMLANPWISNPDDIERFGLSLSDFAVHDQTMDMLQVIQTHRMAINDLKQLNEKLTEQRALLQEQRAEARKLALVASRTDNAVVITDAIGRIEWVNDGFTRITGWTLDEVRGKSPGSFLQGPDTDPVTVEYMRDHLHRGEGCKAEILNYAKSGRPYWLLVEIQPIHDECGNIQNFMAVESDITERRLADQRRTLQYNVSKLLAGRSTLDEALETVLEATCSTMGWKVGNAWRRDRESERLRFAATWQQKGVEVGDFIRSSRRIAFSQGEGLPGRVWLTQSSHWVPNVADDSNLTRAAVASSVGLQAGLGLPIITEGEVWGVLEFFNSNIEEPDQKLMQTLTSIGGLIGQFVARREAEEALRESKEVAEAASRAKSYFLATMSHEIRTPMNGVVGFAKLLGESPLDDEQRDFVSSIRTSAEALLHVINDILDFSKIESGNMDLEKVPFGIQSFVEDALETVSAAALEKNLDLAGRVAPEVPHALVGDSHRLRQIIVNLLGNAVKFTAVGEVRLEVGVGRIEDDVCHVQFSISDTGIGIHEDRIGRLFEPFHQEDNTTTRRFGGTGLGLAICRRLVELMGGRIEVSSKPGEGSQFRLEIPFGVSQQPLPRVGSVPITDFSGLRAMVVDTHEWSRKVTAEILERWGIQVRCTARMQDACDGSKPSVVLLDHSAVDPTAWNEFFRVNPQASVFLLCRPADIHELRARFGDRVAGIISRPVKVSSMFNLLISKVVGRGVEPQPLAEADETPPDCFDRKVLLVEDNVINRKLALALLARIGCVPDIAVDGQDAVARATSTDYDVILMDVQMPGMDGLEATRRIRRWEMGNAGRRTRIIALTANALAGDREICLDAGMDDYLSKPLHFQALREMMLRAHGVGGARQTVGIPASSHALEQLAAELSMEDAMLLVREFMEDLEPLAAQIRAAAELGELDDARRYAHSLKGSSSIFSLEGLRDAASKLEDACAVGDFSSLPLLLSALDASVKNATLELDSGIKHVGSHSILQSMS